MTRARGTLALIPLVVAALAVANPAQAAPQAPASGEPKETSFSASAYWGWAYDQFAPDGIGGYPPNTTTAKHNRQLFGVDFDYRLAGSDTSKARLWLSGETMHGVRSADIDCAAETNKPAVCTPGPGLSYARSVLENATSVEAYLAPRLELATLQQGTSTPTQLYVTARLGFISLEGAPRVFQSHHVGIGLAAHETGLFEGSKFEVGWGNNEMLSGKTWKRFKVDGLLSVGLDGVPGVDGKARLFVQMFIDNDLRGNTPDSIQTFIGFDLDIDKFFKPVAPSVKPNRR